MTGWEGEASEECVQKGALSPHMRDRMSKLYEKGGPALKKIILHDLARAPDDLAPTRPRLLSGGLSTVVATGMLSGKLIAKLGMREALLSRIEQNEPISGPTLTASIKEAFEREFPTELTATEFFKIFGVEYNKAARKHKRQWEKAAKLLDQLDNCFGEIFGEVPIDGEIRGNIAGLRARTEQQLDVPFYAKNVIQPASFFAETFWPVFSDLGVSMRSASLNIADALVALGEIDECAKEKSAESIRQKIIAVNRLIR